MHPLPRHIIAAILTVFTIGQHTRAGSEVTCRAELDRDVLRANTRQTAVIKISLDAPDAPAEGERPPVNLCIVLDRSGSMSGDKLQKAKEGAVQALRRLNGRDFFSLVIYDHNVKTLVPAQSARNVEWIEGRINSIEAGGNTALFGGVSQGAAELRKNLERDCVNRLILLSDGLANVGPSAPQDLERLGSALIKENISVTTVGVGTDYNEDLMTRLSQASDGNAYFVQHSHDLPKIFADELGDVLSVVARKVILEIDFKGGATPIRIIGRDGTVTRDRVRITLNQLYGNQEKYALIEIQVPATEARAVRDLATATVTYENAITRKASMANAHAQARFSEDEQEVVESVNAVVQRDLAINVIAIAKDKSVELMDSGKKQDAVSNLRAVQQQLQQVAEEYEIEGLQEELDDLDAEAATLEREGMDQAARKEFRTDSYKTRNQQQY